MAKDINVKFNGFSKVTVNNWDALYEFYKKFANQEEKQKTKVKAKWIFRGQGAHEDIKTSIERAFDDAGVKVGKKRQKKEREIIRSFKRKAPLYVEDPPERNDTLEWLALMRHYGGPTRLLDWTYSFFVAVFFAVINAKNNEECKDEKKEECNAEIWALNAKWFMDQTYKKYKNKKELPLRNSSKDYKGRNNKKEIAFVDKLIDNPINKLIYNVTPFRLNPRITIQQGTFLLPGDIGVPFMKNFTEELYPTKERKNHLYRIGISINAKERNKILRRLADMNISKATLYPDLGGFAESLNTHRVIISDDV